MGNFHLYVPTRLFYLTALLAVSFVMLFAVARSGYGEDPQTLNADSAALASKPFAQPTTSSPIVIARQLLPTPDLSAQSYVVQFIGENEPLLKSREWKHMKPASLTKILTALIAQEELAQDARIVFSDDAKRVEEKTSPARAGDVFMRDDAIRLALVPSANDAAMALAEAVGEKHGTFTFSDSIEVFATRMNKKAQELGMKDSNFRNPTGLDDDAHYTSAADLFILVSYVWKYHSGLWEISRQPVVQVTPVNGTASYSMQSTDILLTEFPAVLGGKTGLTDGAKQTLILLYPIEELKGLSPNQKSIPRIAVIVLLGSDDRFGDGRKVIQWLEDSFSSF